MLGAGGSAPYAGGGQSAPTFACGQTAFGFNSGGYGGGSSGSRYGGGYRGGGGGGLVSGPRASFGGGGGSYASADAQGALAVSAVNGFANVGATGANGSVLINSFMFNFTGALQQYVIDLTGDYGFTVYGAQGGGVEEARGGYGAQVMGTVHFEAGTILDIIIGGGGGRGYDAVRGNSDGGGGGGGSFVFAQAPAPTVLPGPGSLVLLITGLVAVAVGRRRRHAVEQQPRGGNASWPYASTALRGPTGAVA